MGPEPISSLPCDALSMRFTLEIAAGFCTGSTVRARSEHGPVKKSSAKVASTKRWEFGSFVDEFNEARRLQERLQTTIRELEDSLVQLRRNLHIAHRSADSRPKNESKVKQ
jgi:hypothetical protein